MDDILEKTVELVLEKLKNDIENITVERAVFGLFFSGVKLSTGHGGLCFTPVKEMPEAVCCPSSAAIMPLSGKLSGVPAKQYLEDIFSNNVLRRTLGIATLNALSSLIWEREKENIQYKPIMGVDALMKLMLKNMKKQLL